MPHSRHRGRRPVRNGGNKMLSDVVKSVSELALRVNDANEQRRCEFEWFKSHSELATKRDLEEMEKRLMSKISEFAAKQKEYNDRIDTAVSGLTGDIQVLNDRITELQNSTGAITPEDQALLDDLQARGATIATKLEALDALTPPTLPPA